jgi:hypothetical protein
MEDAPARCDYAFKYTDFNNTRTLTCSREAKFEIDAAKALSLGSTCD